MENQHILKKHPQNRVSILADCFLKGHIRSCGFFVPKA